MSGRQVDPQLAIDERKRKRMDSNRESARRARMKKQHHLEDLINQAELLKNQNMQIELKTNLLTQNYIKVESENCILRAQKSQLTERLQSLNDVLHIVQEVSGMAMDIPEIPDPLLEPWQLPCPVQPIAAVADMLMF